MTETQTTTDAPPEQKSGKSNDPGPLSGLIHTLREQQQAKLRSQDGSEEKPSPEPQA